MWVALCRLADLPPGQTRAFPVPGLAVPVLVANLGGGQLAACSAICPHEDVSLEGGELDATWITCPGHGYEFDLITGRCGHDRSLQLRRFEVRLAGDQVEVSIDLLRGPG
jgi:toluene monooxygenase system ferredoxin subunit